MEKAKAIENLMRIRNMHNQRVFGAINDEEDETLAMAIEALEKAPTALDHIHNVVAENERKRGYEQAKAEYDAKLEEIKSRFKDHYYKKGYEQGKADSTKWIPFTADTMPKEDGEYLIIYEDGYAEDYDLVGCVGIADFHGDCEAFGYWQDYYDPDSLGFVDSDFVEIKVKKWMPIPKDEGE